MALSSISRYIPPCDLFKIHDTFTGSLTSQYLVLPQSVSLWQAKILMEEMVIARERKFEGTAWVGGFGPFPPPGPTATTLTEGSGMPTAGSGNKQTAFVFIKPHACTDAVKSLVAKKFAEVGVSVLSEGTYDGPTIDEKKYIDQHYYAIASKATLSEPASLNVPKDKFSEFFGEVSLYDATPPSSLHPLPLHSQEWDTVLAEGRAYNALGIKAANGWDADTLDEKWDATKESKRIKFGGGFYCGQIEVDGVKQYTFNAFFMTMRGKFTAPGTAIHYYVVEFDPANLKWADFRGKVLGPTDPSQAPADSLRGTLFSDWESLGLTSAPNTGDNGVHASASPFEGLAERINWLGLDPSTDAFGQALVDAGVRFPVHAIPARNSRLAAVVASSVRSEPCSEKQRSDYNPITPPSHTSQVSMPMLKEWTVDPQVNLPGGDGKKGSLFDQLEDMDYSDAVAKCAELAKVQ